MKKNLLIAVALLCGMMIQGQGVYQLWGTTSGGGTDNMGVIFSTDALGNNFQLRHQFTKKNPGGNPYYSTLKEYKGKLYGTTPRCIFEWDPSTNIYVKKQDIGSNGSLLLYNNKFYGMSPGNIFEWDPSTNIYTEKIKFTGLNGANANGSLSFYKGKFYGMTTEGGSNNSGIIFKWDPVSNNFEKQIDFYFERDGALPMGSLTLVGDVFYGLTSFGGSGRSLEDIGGTMFLWEPATNGLFHLFDFSNYYGDSPTGDLTIYNGKLYGMTKLGGSKGGGVIFEFNPLTYVYTNRIELNGENGSQPYSSLLLINDRFYGMTSTGGINNSGVIFEWNPATNVYSKKVDFNESNGTYPYGSLMLSGNKLYGMTHSGGSGSGVIFEWDPNNNKYEKKIDFNINEGAGGAYLAVSKGKFYGTSKEGGRDNAGVLFEFDPVKNIYSKKFEFIDSLGRHPSGNLFAYNSSFYGVTRAGGINDRGIWGGEGVIFEWNPSDNTYKKRIDFNVQNGAYPLGTLTQFNKKFYATTLGGGGYEAGVIFEWDPKTNHYTKKFDFKNSTGGAHPIGTLNFLNQKFYGTTSSGGRYDQFYDGSGIIFEWDPLSNGYIDKLDFTFDRYPSGGLSAYNGKFYGMTSIGGNYSNSGVIYEWDPKNNDYKTKIAFDNYYRTGSNPIGSLTLSANKFYGMAGGGLFGGGIIFEWDPATNVYTKKVDFDGSNGSVPFGEKLTLAPAPVSGGRLNSCNTFPSITIDATNNNQWVSIIDEENNAVAEIKANGNNLGIVTTSMFINSGAVRKDYTNKFYLDRNISITSQVKPTTPIDVRLYIKAAEFEALKNAANINGQPIDSINDLNIFTANSSCTSTSVVLNNAVATTAENWENDYVLSAKVSSLSSFYFAPKPTCSAPVISDMRISTDTLWPPFHSLRGISVAYRTSGDCKCGPITRWLTVKSNEPICGIGSGDKSPDWIIADANHLKLRAERNLNGSGRVYTITIHAKNTAGYVSTYDFTVAVPLTIPATRAAAIAAKQSVEEEVLEQPFNCVISPNPSSGNFNLKIESSSGNKIEVLILDMSGKLINKLDPVKNKLVRFGNELKPGIYMILVKQDGFEKTIKIIKQ